MTGAEAYALLYKAKQHVDECYGYGPVYLDAENEYGEPMSVYSGRTVPPERGDVPKFHVGCCDFCDHWNEPIDDVTVAASIVTLFHEAVGHGFQLRLAYMQTDDLLCSVLAMNFCACQASSRYYGDYGFVADGKLPYFHHCHEMAAQYLGLKSARDYMCLSGSFPFDVEHVLCDYEDVRLPDSDFITVSDGFHFESTDQILEQFELQFPGVVHCHHEYQFSLRELSDKSAVVKGPVDLLELTFCKDGSDRRAKRLSNCRDGMKQDQMAVSVFVDRYPQNRFPALSNVDLRPDKTFGYFSDPMKPVPPDSILKLSHLVELMDDDHNDVGPCLDGP